MKNILNLIIVMCMFCLTACGSNGSSTTSVGSGTKTISGTVFSGGAFLSGVTVTLSGGLTGTATTDAYGNFSITVAKKGDYVLTPSITGYSFTPVSTLVTVKNSDISGKNFIATAAATPTFSITGTVTLNRVGQSGVIVALTGEATGAAITDASGSYSFAGLQNGSYTVTPWPGSYIYPATSLTVTITNANATGINFSSRWWDNNNGTITDMSTGLTWLKDANCTQAAGGIDKTSGGLTWDNAQTWAGGLASGTCGLSDDSVAGNWRVPTIDELSAVSSGTEAVLFGTPRGFSDVQNYNYWSSSIDDSFNALSVDMYDGRVHFTGKLINFYVWPVRSGQ